MDELNKSRTFEFEIEDNDKLLHEVVTENFALRLVACKQDMELHASAIPYKLGEFLTPTKFIDLFARLGISGDVDSEQLESFCQKVSSGEVMEDIILLKGKPPVNGDKQKKVFHVIPKSAEPPEAELYDEKKDYHHLNLFDNVTKNKLVAEMIPETEGVSGKTILGEYTPAIPGEKLKKQLRAGTNITTDTLGLKFYAKIDGMVIFDRRTQVLSITDVYTIKGNVDYTTGDIDFIGTVEVFGDVTDSYNIKAGKDIIVRGHVGDCKLESSGDISLHGFDGGKSGSIMCGGTLKATYLHRAYIESIGDIEIVTEAVNCKLHSEKSILVKTGSIIGGESVALKGFEVKTIGSEANVRTHIISGVSYAKQQAIADMRDKIKELKNQMDVMSKKLDPFITNPRNLLSLNDAGREKIRNMANDFKEVIANKDELEHELTKLRKESLHGANPMVSVVKCIEAEVVITIGTSTKKFTERVIGQNSYIENSVSGGLRTIPYYPVDKSARDIEYAIVRDLKREKGLES